MQNRKIEQDPGSDSDIRHHKFLLSVTSSNWMSSMNDLQGLIDRGGRIIP